MVKNILQIFVANVFKVYIEILLNYILGKDIPMTLMQNILNRSQKAEIIVNLMTGFIRRFFRLDSRTKAINLLIGENEEDSFWKPIILEQNAADGVINFLDLYEKQLKSMCGTDIKSCLFWMRDDRNRLLYNLYFVSHHDKGFVQMKRAMNKVSQSEKSFKFSAFVDKKHPELEKEMVTVEEVKADILQRFEGQEVSGSAITAAIESSPNLIQKYRNPLKRELNEYKTSPDAKRSKFDNTNYYIPKQPKDDGVDNV